MNRTSPEASQTGHADHVLNALLKAAALRESWFEIPNNMVDHRSSKWLSTELDHGYRVIQQYCTGVKMSRSSSERLIGALEELLPKNYRVICDHLNQLDDYDFYKWVETNRTQFDEVDGVYRAINLCIPKKDRGLIPSDRLAAIQRLKDVRIVHYSHSWQGPYKAALLYGQDRALRIEFSDRQSLLFNEPVRTRDYPLARHYMRTVKAERFAQALRSTVDPRDLTPLQRLMLEVLPQDNLAA